MAAGFSKWLGPLGFAFAVRSMEREVRPRFADGKRFFAGELLEGVTAHRPPN